MTGTLVIVIIGAAGTVGIGCAVAIFKACTTEFQARIQSVAHRTWQYFWPTDDNHSPPCLPL